jgi:hypothetical protein
VPSTYRTFHFKHLTDDQARSLGADSCCTHPPWLRSFLAHGYSWVGGKRYYPRPLSICVARTTTITRPCRQQLCIGLRFIVFVPSLKHSSFYHLPTLRLLAQKGRRCRSPYTVTRLCVPARSSTPGPQTPDSPAIHYRRRLSRATPPRLGVAIHSQRLLCSATQQRSLLRTGQSVKDFPAILFLKRYREGTLRALR